jgi:hypothetical protein
VTYLDNGEKIKWHQRQVPYVLDGIYPGMQRVRYGKLTGVLTSVRKPKHGAYNHFVYMMIRNQEGGHLQVTILKEDLSRLVSDGRVNCSGVEIEFLKGWQNEQKPDQEKPDDNPGKKPRSNDDGLLRIFQNSCLAVGSDCRPQVVREYLWIVLKSAKSLGFIDFDEEKLKSRCLPKPSDGASSAPDSAQFVLPFKEPGASPNEFNAADAAAHVMTEARKIMVQQYRSETLEKLRNLPTVDLLALIDDCSPLNQAGALKIAQDEFKRRLGIG